MEYKLQNGKTITDTDIQQWVDNKLSIHDIAVLLGVSDRTTYRLLKRFKIKYIPPPLPPKGHNIKQYRIYSKGITITAEQWQEWQGSGKTAEDIMDLLGINLCTLNNISRRLGKLEKRPNHCEICRKELINRNAKFCPSCAYERALKWRDRY